MEDEASGKAKSDARRRRAVVAIACQRCRRLKQACDGLRPDCSPCSRRNAKCEYERVARDGESRQAALKRELGVTKRRLEDVSDAVEFLRKIPTDRAEEIFELIKSANDPIEALSSLHHSIQSGTALSNYKATKATFPPTGSRLAYELSISHPASYPILIPVNQALIPIDWGPGSAHLPSRAPIPPAVLTAPLIEGGPQPLSAVSDGPSESQYGADDIPTSLSNVFGPLQPSNLVDRRLHFLNIRQWTEVVISNELAANMISLYFETDHPILGWFDVELFITALCSGLSNFCSPFLVSALLYWTCKGYSALDIQSVSLGSQFLTEAKWRWNDVREREDSVLTVAACMILSLGLACDGEDSLAGDFKRNGTAMCERLGLFNVSKSPDEITVDQSMPANVYRSKAHIAWGAFNWSCLHASYYDGQPANPPTFHIPQHDLPYMGNSFSAVCKFRRIVAEVISVYNARDYRCVADRIPLSFAERKYQELLEWADGLDATQRRRPGAPHHVMILHIWYHTAILDIFRPYVLRDLILQTFSAESGTPEAICEASLNQLKCLVVEYRQWQPSALYSILWHTSMLYIGNAVLNTPSSSPDWRFYFELCVDTYLHLFTCYRIAAGFLQALVFIAVKNGFLSRTEAKTILTQLVTKGKVLQAPPGVASTHIVDFQQALTDKSSSQIEMLAEKIGELVTGDPIPQHELE